MSVVTRPIPIDLSGCDCHRLACAAVAGHDSQGLARGDNRNKIKRISALFCGRAAGADSLAHRSRSTLVKRFLDHSASPAGCFQVPKTRVHRVE